MMRSALPFLLFAAAALAACGGPRKQTTLEDDPGATSGDPEADDSGTVEIVKYEKKAAELLEATNKLNQLQGTLEEQVRRLQLICVDYPDHQVCAPQTAASYAREAFCSDA